MDKIGNVSPIFNNDIPRLMECRKRIGWTQEKVADYLQRTVKTYRGYEQGGYCPPGEVLVMLSDLYGVSIDYLLGRDPDYTTKGNKYIGESTGLSDKAIRALRYIFQSKDETACGYIGGITFAPGLKNNLLCVNLLLELLFEDLDLFSGAIDKPHSPQILADLYTYLCQENQEISVWSGKEVIRDVHGIAYSNKGGIPLIDSIDNLVKEKQHHQILKDIDKLKEIMQRCNHGKHSGTAE